MEGYAMRKATFLAVLGAALLALPGVAGAAPSVKFKATAVPISGFKGTGNILGAGAAVKSEYEISGTEYFGSPPPIIGINYYFPKGTLLHSTGFPTCAEEVLRIKGPIGCPKGSEAGPVGSVLGYVTFGGERVEETAENFSYYKPGGGFTFFTDGHSPVSLEVYSQGAFKSLTSSPGGYGPELHVTVPLVASVPGAPYASVKTIDVKAGSAWKVHGKTIYYGRLPKKCHGGLNVKTEVIFAENGEESKPLSVPATYKAPCPRK